MSDLRTVDRVIPSLAVNLHVYLSALQRPFIVTSVVDQSIPGAIRTIKQAEYAGATAFEVHLPLLGFPGEEGIRRLSAATSYPIYATCRRDRFYDLFGISDSFDYTDAERINLLIEAVEAGCDAVDFELDTFDPTERPDKFSAEGIAEYANDPGTTLAEITDNSDAVAQQRESIERVHDAGGEVVLSCHTWTHIGPEAAVAIAQRIDKRGGDFAKIVGYDEDMRDLLDTLEAQLDINERVDVPYSLMAIGTVSRIHRPLSPMFGSAWVFGRPRVTSGSFQSWPLVENAREILRRVDWRTAYDPHST